MLLEAAVEVGYARVTFGAIAQHAGLTTAALQHHFDTKADLIHAVLVERLMPVMEKDGLESLAGRSVRVRCQTLADLYWSSYGDPAYPVVCDIILGARDDPDLAGRIRRFESDKSIFAGQQRVFVNMLCPYVEAATTARDLSA